MKKNIQILLLSVFSFVLGSCSVYEDVYFNADGTVDYSLKFDASAMMTMIPDANSIGRMPADSTISIAQIVEEHKDSLHTLTDENREVIETLMPLTLNVVNDTIAKTLHMTLSGDFKDADTLNKAFTTLNKINRERKSKKEETDISKSKDIPDMDFSSYYTWDGKIMKRIVSNENTADIPQEAGMKSKELMMLFSGGKMIVRYHFPDRIKAVSNDKALFSQDGKTIVVEYPSSVYINPKAEELDIEIEVE